MELMPEVMEMLSENVVIITFSRYFNYFIMLSDVFTVVKCL